MDHWLTKIKKIHLCSLDLETSSLDEMDASIVGISLSVRSGLACYIPVGHKLNITNELSDKQNFSNQLSLSYVLEKLRPILEDHLF